MVYSYIVSENTTIVAIRPANQDLVNSNSLIAARGVARRGTARSGPHEA
jgi:hypothetical protein